MAAAARRPRGERPSPPGDRESPFRYGYVRYISNTPASSLSSTISFVTDRTPIFPRKRSPDAIVIGRQDQEASPGKGLFPGQTGGANRFQQKLPLGARKPRYTQAVGRKADANRRSPLRHDGLPARRICRTQRERTQGGLLPKVQQA